MPIHVCDCVHTVLEYTPFCTFSVLCIDVFLPNRLEDMESGIGLDLLEEEETAKLFPASNSGRDVSDKSDRKESQWTREGCQWRRRWC